MGMRLARPHRGLQQCRPSVLRSVRQAARHSAPLAATTLWLVQRFNFLIRLTASSFRPPVTAFVEVSLLPG
jgi:hypothetical protein